MHCNIVYDAKNITQTNGMLFVRCSHGIGLPLEKTVLDVLEEIEGVQSMTTKIEKYDWEARRDEIPECWIGERSDIINEQSTAVRKSDYIHT